MTQAQSTALHQTGALFLAAALSEMFPKVPLHFGGGTDLFFFCDCDFPSPISTEMSSLLEERIRLFLKKPGEIELVEMMTRNAAHYFAKEGKSGVAESLERLDQATVSLYRVEGALVYLPLPESFSPLEKREMTPHVRLILQGNVHRNGKKLTRLVGVWAEEKDELKKRVRGSESLLFHEEIAENLSFAFLGPFSWVWRQSGLALRESLVARLWREGSLQKKISTISCSPCIGLEGGEKGVVNFFLETLADLPEKRIGALFFLNENGDSEGFLSPEISTCDRLALLCLQENFFEEMISSLQFILQIPKILDFECEIVISVSSDAPKKVRSEALAACEKALRVLGKVWRVEKVSQLPYLARIEIRIRDALGRYWLGPFVGIASSGKEANKVIFASLYYSLERMMALLLEKEQGAASLEGLVNKLKSKQE